jgi:hypothetical protein
VIDHEARHRSKAARSEPLTVAVARQDEDVHGLGGGHDLVFDAPSARLERGGVSELGLGLGEQLVRGLLGDLAQRLRRPVRRGASAQ